MICISILINNMREFYCLVDLLLNVLNDNSSMKIDMTYSGIIKRYNNGKFEMAKVNDSKARIIAKIDPSGYILRSTSSQGVVKWLSKCSSGEYLNVSSYLTYIDKLDIMVINSITIGGLEVVDIIECDGRISVYNLLKYVCDNCEVSTIKTDITNGCKKISLIYDNGLLYRYVKINSTFTLYINNETKYKDLFNDYNLCGFMLGAELPDITSQIDLLKHIAETNHCGFEYV